MLLEDLRELRDPGLTQFISTCTHDLSPSIDYLSVIWEFSHQGVFNLYQNRAREPGADSKLLVQCGASKASTSPDRYPLFIFLLLTGDIFVKPGFLGASVALKSLLRSVANAASIFTGHFLIVQMPVD